MNRLPNKAVCGGTFDPCTIGHQRMIEKASCIFDEVIIAISPNINKSPMFSIEERMDMLKFITNHLKNVSIVVLPENIYLANYAHSVLKAKFLIRGIRNGFDLQFEHDLSNTNREIQCEIETIYLMPDAGHEVVSSSWVKALVGHVGWKKLLNGKVSSKAIKYLQREWLHKRFVNLCYKIKVHDRAISNPSIAESLWKNISEAYSSPKRSYHNLDHIAHGIELIDKHYTGKDRLAIEFAWFMHDRFNNDLPNKGFDEEESAIFTYHQLCPSSFKYTTLEDVEKRNVDFEDFGERVLAYIMATKHKVDHYDTPDEEFIASIDLTILGSHDCAYSLYVRQVFEEYFSASGESYWVSFEPKWKQGRMAFLKKFLARERIFTNALFRDMFEKKAQANLSNEYHFLLKEQEMTANEKCQENTQIF